MDYRYHCYLPATGGVNTLPINPCSLLAFNLLTLGAGQTWSGSSGDREILAVILGGTADLTVGARSSPRSAAGRTCSPASLTPSTSRSPATS